MPGKIPTHAVERPRSSRSSLSPPRSRSRCGRRRAHSPRRRQARRRLRNVPPARPRTMKRGAIREVPANQDRHSRAPTGSDCPFQAIAAGGGACCSPCRLSRQERRASPATPPRAWSRPPSPPPTCSLPPRSSDLRRRSLSGRVRPHQTQRHRRRSAARALCPCVPSPSGRVGLVAHGKRAASRSSASAAIGIFTTRAVRDLSIRRGVPQAPRAHPGTGGSHSRAGTRLPERIR